MGTFRRIATNDGEIAQVSGFRDDERVVVFENGQAYEFQLTARSIGGSHGLHDGELEAPMPGKVTAVEVKLGEKVVKGQRILTLEAMKMEHALTAPFNGCVVDLAAVSGAQVSEGQLLARIEMDWPSRATEPVGSAGDGQPIGPSHRSRRNKPAIWSAKGVVPSPELGRTRHPEMYLSQSAEFDARRRTAETSHVHLRSQRAEQCRRSLRRNSKWHPSGHD